MGQKVWISDRTKCLKSKHFFLDFWHFFLSTYLIKLTALYLFSEAKCESGKTKPKKPVASHLEVYGTCLIFWILDTVWKYEYSHAPRTGRLVWQTGRKSVRILNVRISNVGLVNLTASGCSITERPITGHNCPDFIRSNPKTGSKPITGHL